AACTTRPAPCRLKRRLTDAVAPTALASEWAPVPRSDLLLLAHSPSDTPAAHQLHLRISLPRPTAATKSSPASSLPSYPPPPPPLPPPPAHLLLSRRRCRIRILLLL